MLLCLIPDLPKYMCKLLMLLNVDTHILINGKHKQILICFNLVTFEILLEQQELYTYSWLTIKD